MFVRGSPYRHRLLSPGAVAFTLSAGCVEDTPCYKTATCILEESTSHDASATSKPDASDEAGDEMQSTGPKPESSETEEPSPDPEEEDNGLSRLPTGPAAPTAGATTDSPAAPTAEPSNGRADESAESDAGHGEVDAATPEGGPAEADGCDASTSRKGVTCDCPLGYSRTEEGDCVSVCGVDNGGCDLLTACDIDESGIVCGPCPAHYVGSGLEGCTPAPRCDPTKPFGTAVPVVDGINLSTEKEYAAMVADGLTLFVSYDGSAVRTTRDSLYEEFGAPTTTSVFNDVFDAVPGAALLSLTADGLLLFFQDGRQGRVYSASRPDASSAFRDIIKRDDLVGPDPEFPLPLAGVWVTPGGERVYAFELATYAIYYLDRLGSRFGPPVTILDTPEAKYAIRMTADELIAYFAVTGAPGNLGTADIWRAARASTDDDFDPWTHIPALNSELWDEPVWISDDDCEVFLRRESLESPSDPVPNEGIYVARRPL